MMDMSLLVLLFGLLVPACLCQKCDDIDTSACKLMLTQRPNLCQDPTLSVSACPRFCKLCPVECYHCNATVLDYHECNTTMLCPEGQVCMRKELKSFVDGHHEYEMTCESKQVCDGGSGLVIPFGKREMQSRDISVTCCAEDLCNYPGSVVAGCPKDIVFMVDVSSRVLLLEHTAVIDAITEVAKQLNIGLNDNLIALFTYDRSIHTKFGLQQHPDKNDLLAALQGQNLFSHTFNTVRGDTQDAVKFLIDSVLQPQAGDRPNFPDAVVIIGDSITTQNVHIGIRERLQLQHLSNDVIVVSVGGQSGATSGTNNLDAIATDSNHTLHVQNLYNTQAFAQDLLQLLQKC